MTNHTSNYAPCPAWCETHTDDQAALRLGEFDRMHLHRVLDNEGHPSFDVQQPFHGLEPDLAVVTPNFDEIYPESHEEVRSLVEMFQEALNYALESNLKVADGLHGGNEATD